MPRKRRKSCVNKEPLIFTESPVNKQRNAPSPVYCARHPTTAQSVPVEDCSSLAWVSPQFRSVPATVKGQRRARRRKVSPTDSANQKPCTCHCGASGSSSAKRGGKRSKFQPLVFLGERTPAQTIIQDIDITDDYEKSPCSNIRNRSRSGAKFDSGKGSGRTRRIVTRQRQKKSCDLNGSVVHDLSQVSVPTPTANELEKENFAMHESCTEEEAPVKRLFAGSNDGDISDSKSPHFKSKRKLRTGNVLRTRLLENLNVTLSGSEASSTQRREVCVIVPDTPEAEYGMCNRQRRLRGYTNSQSVSSKFGS